MLGLHLEMDSSNGKECEGFSFVYASCCFFLFCLALCFLSLHMRYTLQPNTQLEVLLPQWKCVFKVLQTDKVMKGWLATPASVVHYEGRLPLTTENKDIFSKPKTSKCIKRSAVNLIYTNMDSWSILKFISTSTDRYRSFTGGRKMFNLRLKK